MTRLNDYRTVLEPALARSGGSHAWDDVVEGVASGYMQLWANGRSAAITQIIRHPQKTVLVVFLAGGDMGELLDMLEDAKLWGAGEGCEEIQMHGRRGWLRVLGKHGWGEQFTTMSSPIL